MISLQAINRVCVCHARVDFRKAHNGLYASAVASGLDPYNGDLIVFVGRRRDRIKMLFRDHSGILMLYKLFDRERLRHFRFLNEPQLSEISCGEVAMLLEGQSSVLKNCTVLYPNSFPS